mmetsp:Transcript_38814/g.123342  ORF Transcript_38814/g.123342 Transcript_38814/m.123342 type:complete len:204 (-) Transcript_38814:1078-1689(-)
MPSISLIFQTSLGERATSSRLATVTRVLGTLSEILKSVRCVHAHLCWPAVSHPSPAKACRSGSHQHSSALPSSSIRHPRPENRRNPSQSYVSLHPMDRLVSIDQEGKKSTKVPLVGNRNASRHSRVELGGAGLGREKHPSVEYSPASSSHQPQLAWRGSGSAAVALVAFVELLPGVVTSSPAGPSVSLPPTISEAGARRGMEK